jgi:hypothetical protein
VRGIPPTVQTVALVLPVETAMLTLAERAAMPVMLVTMTVEVSALLLLPLVTASDWSGTTATAVVVVVAAVVVAVVVAVPAAEPAVVPAVDVATRAKGHPLLPRSRACTTGGEVVMNGIVTVGQTAAR